MVLKPRWVVPLNFRSEDKALLDNAMFLAKKEELNITEIIRNALTEYTRRKLNLSEAAESHKIDEFLVSNSRENSIPNILTREELKSWQDSDVLSVAKMVRARKQELEIELRKRGYYLVW
jgi:hypothetical protein